MIALSRDKVGLEGMLGSTLHIRTSSRSLRAQSGNAVRQKQELRGWGCSSVARAGLAARGPVLDFQHPVNKVEERPPVISALGR